MVFPAKVMDLDGLAQAAQPAGLDVDDSAGLHLDRVAGMARRHDAFVEADRSSKFSLQFMMIPDIIFEERLFDQQ